MAIVIENLRLLREDWFGTDGYFERAINAALDKIGFSESYVRTIQESWHGSEKSKVIKDNIWGMIEVDAASIRLLDSPLVQRLRGIRQLGFSYLTYPSAEHSRFAHSLGMYGVVQSLLRSAENSKLSSPADDRLRVPSEAERLELLHAAILHDCGHLPFSHAGESAFESGEDFKVGNFTLKEFKDAAADHEFGKASLSELLSVAFVLAPRFERFYTKHVVRGHDPRNDHTLRLASLILGKSPNPRTPGYSGLISGETLDADKLDYVKRDSNACGIPVGIDVGRIFLRSCFIELSPEKLRELYKREGHDAVVPDDAQVHFVVNASGTDTIEEVIAAKMSLYHRVYFHQTTRNAERLFQKGVHGLQRLNEEEDGDLYRDVLHVWPLSDFELLSRLSTSNGPTSGILIQRLAQRRLPKRALTLWHEDMRLFFPWDDALPTMQRRDLESQLRDNFLNTFQQSSESSSVTTLDGTEHQIVEEAWMLRSLLSKQLSDMLTERPTVTILPLRRMPQHRTQYFVQRGQQLAFAKDFTRTKESADSTDSFKAAGYVMADDPWREVVFVAARKVLAREFLSRLPVTLGLGKRNSNDGVQLSVEAFGTINFDPDIASRKIGLDQDLLGSIYTQAGNKGYFDDFPALQPMEVEGIETLAEKFRDFKGEFGWTVTAATVRAYIQQFPNWLRADVMAMLREVQRINPIEVAQLLTKPLGEFANRFDTNKPIHITQLSPNSGAEVRYGLDTLIHSAGMATRFKVHKSIRELLGDKSTVAAPIVLVDDNLVSGTQAVAQLCQWLGIDRAEFPDRVKNEKNINIEQLTKPMKRQLTTALKDKRFAICVGIGQPDEAEENLRLFLDKVFGSVVPGEIDALLDGLLFCAEPIDQSTKISNELREYLKRVGISLMAHARYKTTVVRNLSSDQLADCERRALGYGGRCGLSVTSRSVPTSTVTALWCPGIFEGRPWFPLILRSTKVSDLVLG